MSEAALARFALHGAVIRGCQLNDLLSLVELALQCFPALDKKDVNSLLAKSTEIWVAIGNGVVVGFLVVKQQRKQGRLTLLGVSEAYRRNGLASALVKQFHDYYTGCDTIVELRADNVAATKLYLNLGYRVAGFERGVYAKPKDNGLIMKRKASAQ